MNTDIRIAISFKGHRKRKKFRMLLKNDMATDYLIDFWIAVATDRPDGDLSGLDVLDIALMAGWDGDPSQFVNAMVAAGFLDEIATGYQVHEWSQHNGYASSAAERSDRARFSRMARLHPAIYAELKENGVNAVSAAVYKSLTKTVRPFNDHSTTVEEPLTKRTSPSPSPSPSPSLTTDKTFCAILPIAPGASENCDKEGVAGKQDEPKQPPEQEQEFYLTHKKKKLAGQRLKDFERFWQAFAYRKDRAKAADSWLNIPNYSPELVDEIVRAAEEEARARPALIEKDRTPIYAQGWLSGRRWEDDEDKVGDTSPKGCTTAADLERIRKLREERKKQLEGTGDV